MTGCRFFMVLAANTGSVIAAIDLSRKNMLYTLS